MLGTLLQYMQTDTRPHGHVKSLSLVPILSQGAQQTTYLLTSCCAADAGLNEGNTITNLPYSIYRTGKAIWNE